jgi:hypothetical protein
MMDLSRMTQMPGSAISTTKSEVRTKKAFASLRFKGDRLEPSRMTEVLEAAPTTAYRKGEVYKRNRGHEARGRTGLWMLSSKGRVLSANLDDHLRYLLAILFASDWDRRLRRLRDLMREEEIEADVTCFWYGGAGAQPPVIPPDVRAALARLPAAIVTDFETD